MFEEKDHEREGALSTYQGPVLGRGLVTVAGIDLDRLAEMYPAVFSTRVLFFSPCLEGGMVHTQGTERDVPPPGGRGYTQLE